MRHVLLALSVIFVFAVLAISSTDSSAFATEPVPPPFTVHYFLEPRDVIDVEAIHLVPKDPHQVPTLPRAPFQHEEGNQQITGKHVVGSDGYVTFGSHGRVYVKGLTINECKKAFEFHFSKHFDNPQVVVNGVSFISKGYYVFFNSREQGERILKFPYTGNEKVFDAIVNASKEGVQPNSSMEIWIERPMQNSDKPVRLPVNWVVNDFGKNDTNFQLLPGDRVWVQDRVWAEESEVATSNVTKTRVFAPLQRIRVARR
jgi:hypothetical protein